MSDPTLTCDDLRERFIALEKYLSDPLSECYIERLLDVVIAAVDDSKHNPKAKENEHLMSFYKRFADVAQQLRSHRRQPQDFHPIASLGRGAFGRVQLVREITTGRVCAMKVLKKSRMLTQLTDYWTEREIMARCDSPWIVQLYYAFQDSTSLYMVMEYVPGGNLVGWMEEVEVISEAACRFYAAETVLALSDLHAMGFIHRDLKPDNLLLDAGGHVKLADFGTAIRVDPETQLIHCDAAVGTPDYLSPEVLLSQGGEGGSYGFEVDWWALGVLVYEMLYGDTPFYSEALVHTYAKIMSHANHLKFPDNVQVSDEGLDFMKQLLRDRDSRLGSGPGGSIDVLNHSWFSADWATKQKSSGALSPTDLSLLDWSWSNIRACRAPFQPQLTSETDTAYFQLDADEDDEDDTRTEQPANGEEQLPSTTNKASPETDRSLFKYPGVQLAFAGFSFSSSHPNHLALLNGLHLTSHPDPIVKSPTAVTSPVNGVNGGSTPECDRLDPSDLSSQQETTSNQHSHQLARLQSQLEDALALAELHSNEVVELTEQLDRSASQRRELENKLSHLEATQRSSVEELQQRLEMVRSEAATNMIRLEAEVAKWKALAQSEQSARQSAEAAGSEAVAAATARLAKRAAEVADRVVSSGSRNSLISSLILEHTGTNEAPGSDELHAAVSSDVWDQGQTAATNLLLSRVEEMAKRAHRAELAAREAADKLETEQHFSRLYKETAAEKSDQLKELNRELDEARELLASSQQDCRRCHEECEAARRALAEEQQRCIRYREASRTANESAESASRRANVARKEAADLRESLEQMKRDYATEKLICSEAVRKLSEVMSGANTDALEIMYSASTHSSKVGSGIYLGSIASRNKLAAMLGNRQQQQLNNKLKRLNNEIKRLNAELSASRREAQTLRDAISELTRMREQSAVIHSRENSDDLTTGGRSSALRPQRSGFFGRNKLVMSAGDGERTLTVATSVDGNTPRPHGDQSIQRHGSLGEHSALGLFPLSPNVNPADFPKAISSTFAADMTNFTISGLLQMGVRQQRKKKLAWCPRVVKLTRTHLFVWEYNAETAALVGVEDSDAPDTSPCLPPNPLLELPLKALYRVRQVDPSEAIHEVPENLTFVFQVTYDRYVLEDSDPISPITPTQSGSMTLPRKFSFGSATVFSTSSNTPSSSFLRRQPTTDSLGSSIKRPNQLGSSNEHLYAVNPSKSMAHPGSPHLLLIRGHKLQSIRFPRMAFCDLCHKPCWQLVNPPPAFQCIHCQLKFHASHLDAQDCALPDCGKAIASHLFRCENLMEQQKWMAHVFMAIQYARSVPAAGSSQAAMLHSPETSSSKMCDTEPLSVYSPTETTSEGRGSPVHRPRSPGRTDSRPPLSIYSEQPSASLPSQAVSCERIIITDPPPVLRHVHSGTAAPNRSDRNLSPPIEQA